MNKIYKTLAFTLVFFLLYAIWECYNVTYRAIRFYLPLNSPYENELPPRSISDEYVPPLEVQFYNERLHIFVFFLIVSIIIVYVPYLIKKMKDKKDYRANNAVKAKKSVQIFGQMQIHSEIRKQ